MTLILLGAVIMDRRALTMRNLAFAVFAVVAIEPEAILGVSFQLSFAAVAALVAVMEARLAGLESDPDPYLPQRGVAPPGLFADLLRKPLALIFATACATAATASFMAYHFHDLSPYVSVSGLPISKRDRVLRGAGRASRRRALSARARRPGLGSMSGRGSNSFSCARGSSPRRPARPCI
jgi:hypothetical protein